VKRVVRGAHGIHLLGMRCSRVHQVGASLELRNAFLEL
jgi:hypothetical protein